MTNIRNTRFGFVYGPAYVARLCDDEKFGAIVAIVGAKQTVEVRITPRGLVRLDKVRKTSPHHLAQVTE